MHRTFAFLLCLSTLPALALDDACTKPRSFTIDKRCYVTDAQKKQKPFNATVGILDPYSDINLIDAIVCTGTIVKKDGNLYLYTAKHCTDNDYDNRPDSKLYIRTQDGYVYAVTYVESGNYDIKEDINHDGDYAIYRLPTNEKSLPYAVLGNRFGFNSQVIGYGILKIMSDVEIRDFKKQYINFMRRNGEQPDVEEHDIKNESIVLNSSTGKDFVLYLRNHHSAYYKDMFDSSELKVSTCIYTRQGDEISCQTWGGNSGGGIFDNKGDLIGIHTRGAKNVGGKYHASREFTTNQRSIVSIPIAFQ